MWHYCYLRESNIALFIAYFIIIINTNQMAEKIEEFDYLVKIVLIGGYC